MYREPEERAAHLVKRKPQPTAGGGFAGDWGADGGGSDILGYILQKKPHLSIGRALIIVDGLVLALSIFVFKNVESGLFGG